MGEMTATGKLRELIAKWRTQANYSMQHSIDREAHVAAAADLVCADELEAAIGAGPLANSFDVRAQASSKVAEGGE